jgi:hypothetical protein
MGKLGRIGLEAPQRYERARPCELLQIDVNKLGRIQGGAGHRIAVTSTTTQDQLTSPASVASPSAGSTYTSRSMTPLAWPRRGSGRREGRNRRRLPSPRRRPLRCSRHHCAAAHHRQRLGLLIRDSRDRLPPARSYRPQTNAVVETFFATLKKELVHRRTWPNRLELQSTVFEYIEAFYNRQRRHSTLNMHSPVQYEQLRLSPLGG